MALVPTVLTRALADAFADPATTPLAAASRQARAYGAYAQLAQAGGIPWVPTGAEETRLRLALLGAMFPLSTPDRFAEAWATGLAAFWMLPPLVFGPGVVTAFGGQTPLQVGLAALFSNPQNPSSLVAASLAAALDAATRTVLVTLPVVGPTPLV